jgi:hypothetical protein
MQALNDDLNPKKTSLSDKSKIPGLIRNLLVDNAYKSGGELTVSSERRNMVNPLKTLIAASPKVVQDLQDFQLKGYNVSIGYDELDVKKQYDDKNTAYNIMFMQNKAINPKFKIDPVFHGVIGLIDGPNHKDAEWFNITYPSDPGVYGDGILQITIPNGSVSKFGRVKINGVLYPPVQNSIKPDESTIEVKIPDMLYGCEFPIKIEGYPLEDNVYNMKFIPGKRIGDAPYPDKYDNSNPNPAGYPNNNEKKYATPIAYSDGINIYQNDKTLYWQLVKSDNLYKYYEVNVTDLNFHTCDDQDWFSILPPPDYLEICGHLMCSIPITVTCSKEGKPVNTLVTAYDNSNALDKNGNPIPIYEDVLTPIDIGCAGSSLNDYPLFIKLQGAGAPIQYDLKVSLNMPVDVKKYVGKCDEQWQWVKTLKYPPIKLDRNWGCEWGLDPVLFQVEWTNNGGINWSGGGLSFLMQGTVMSSGLSMQLFNSEGNLMSQSFTEGMNSPNANVMLSESPQGITVLNLEQANLPEGTYYLLLSGNTSHNEVQFLLPRNLLFSTNSPAIEDFQGITANVSGGVTSGFILNPVDCNMKLIFR